MNFNEYQDKATESAIYPRGDWKQMWSYLALGLSGEAGEIAEKVKKSLRDGPPEDIEDQIAKELGDVLWYLSEMAGTIGYTLDEIAAINLAKAASRVLRGVVSGSGDER